MATFTINVGEFNNEPPYQIGELQINIDYNTSYIFTTSNFSTDLNPPYADPEDDDPLKIKLLSLPNDIGGTLYLNGVELSVDDEITFAQILAEEFTFVPEENNGEEYSTLFYFDIADEGSGEYGGLEGTIQLNISSTINLPPTSVGDAEETLEYGNTLVFTRDMFTVDTDPAYVDPEGDPAYSLRIVTLPSSGVIKLSGTNVAEGQEISFIEIDNGELTYTPNTNITSTSIQSFEFEIADEGSNQYVG